MIVGNYIESGNYLPEIVGIANDQNQFKLGFQNISFRDVWDPPIYGMVGTMLNRKLFFCGGGALSSTCDTEGYLSTSKCNSFDVQDYTLNLLDIEMLEERTFAQSMIFENGTWFIMGGQDSQGIASDTTEYLYTLNEDYFMIGSVMPEYLSHHCAKMINSSHLFTTGGAKRSSLADHSISLSKGYKIVLTNMCTNLNFLLAGQIGQIQN